MRDGRKEEEYYIKKNCYGNAQKDRSTNLVEGYWRQRHLWNAKFDQTTLPTTQQTYYWLISKEDGKSLFHNIGSLTALLICGDLIEAGLVPMPSPEELGKLIFNLGKGAREGMIMIGLVKYKVNREELCKAFKSLDLTLQQELTRDEKEAMGYNVIMLEHTLCKIKCLIMRGISLLLLLSEIN